MRTTTNIRAFLLALLLTTGTMHSGVAQDFLRETRAEREARMAWWREARFGLFIHWGIYAIPAGSYRGERIQRSGGEWIMTRASIPLSEYEQLAPRFNPVNFEADAWVRLARDAGMKYIVITAKHHDGFSLYDADVSTYDIVDATPFKRDVLKELAEAARRHGIKLGSQAWDAGYRSSGLPGSA